MEDSTATDENITMETRQLPNEERELSSNGINETDGPFRLMRLINNYCVCGLSMGDDVRWREHVDSTLR